jgi:hypothetical protein
MRTCSSFKRLRRSAKLGHNGYEENGNPPGRIDVTKRGRKLPFTYTGDTPHPMSYLAMNEENEEAQRRIELAYLEGEKEDDDFELFAQYCNTDNAAKTLGYLYAAYTDMDTAAPSPTFDEVQKAAIALREEQAKLRRLQTA